MVKGCIISGRALGDLVKRVDIPEIIWIDNRGLEISGIDMDVPADKEMINGPMREVYGEAASYVRMKSASSLTIRTWQ
jgi:hypothetical protein